MVNRAVIREDESTECLENPILFCRHDFVLWIILPPERPSPWPFLPSIALDPAIPRKNLSHINSFHNVSGREARQFHYFELTASLKSSVALGFAASSASRFLRSSCSLNQAAAISESCLIHQVRFWLSSQHENYHAVSHGDSCSKWSVTTTCTSCFGRPKPRVYERIKLENDSQLLCLYPVAPTSAGKKE